MWIDGTTTKKNLQIIGESDIDVEESVRR